MPLEFGSIDLDVAEAQDILIFDRDWAGFLGRPIALSLLGIRLLLLIGPHLLALARVHLASRRVHATPG